MRSLRAHLRSLSNGPASRTPKPPPAVLPQWSASDVRPRVVVEHEDPVWRWAAAGLLEEAGYQVGGCGGPHELAGGECPLVTDGQCTLIEGADAVVNGLGIRDPGHRAVLASVRAHDGGLPVLVELPSPQRERLQADFPGCQQLPFPVRPQDLVEAVGAAIEANASRA